MALSTLTKRLITDVIKAAKEEAFEGAAPPQDRPKIKQKLKDARAKLEDHLLDLL